MGPVLGMDQRKGVCSFCTFIGVLGLLAVELELAFTEDVDHTLDTDFSWNFQKTKAKYQRRETDEDDEPSIYVIHRRSDGNEELIREDIARDENTQFTTGLNGEYYKRYPQEQIPGMNSWIRKKERWILKNRRKKRSPVKVYTIEALVVVDFAIYKRWFNESKHQTSLEKDKDAKSQIRHYFSHIINGINLRFNNLPRNDIKINIILSGIVIATTPAASWWTDDFTKPRPESRDLIPVDTVFRSVVWWRGIVENIPEHDHVFMFTGHDLYAGEDDTRTAGYGYIGSMCTAQSVSIMEEHGAFTGISIAAHEVGHSLGAHHDGINNSCAGRDQYIMASSYGNQYTDDNQYNLWMFSNCSLGYFNTFIRNLGDHNCLTDDGVLFDEREYHQHLSTQPGQVYGPNEQCRQLMGPASFYGWSETLGSMNSVCANMACAVPDDRGRFRIHQAARGTSCGNKKWCLNGRCTESDSAPETDDNCVHGDTERLFDNQTCSEYIRQYPHYCYNSFYQSQCCQTCREQKTGVEGCEYGDRTNQCQAISTRVQPFLCYANYDLCCSTCSQFYTGVTGCEYGDKQSNCYQYWCGISGNEQYDQMCCGSCEMDGDIQTDDINNMTASVGTDITEQINSGNMSTSENNTNCFVKDENFHSISCEYLHTVFGERVCRVNFLANSECCQPCNATNVTGECEDGPKCDVTYPWECYDEQVKNECCSTCETFYTNITGCEYGDRIGRAQCNSLVFYDTYQVTCQQHRDWCCQTCHIPPNSDSKR